MSRRRTDIMARGSDARRLTQRRTRSLVDRKITVPPLETLKADVLKRIQQAFRHESALSDTHLDANSVAFLTDNVKTEGHITTLQEITQGRQMLLTDQELILAFDLREAKKGDKVERGVGNSYIRSLAVTVRELLVIIDAWDTVGYHPPEVDLWLDLIRGLKLDDVVFLRYIGQAVGPSTPWDRFWKDICHRRYGFFGDVVTALMEHAPGAIRTGNCYVFTSAAIPPMLPARKLDALQNLREQLLIGLFHLRSLLNRQPGGTRPSHAPQESDVTLWQLLCTSVFARFSGLEASSEKTASIKSEMRIRLACIWKDYVRFGDEDPVATGTAVIPYRDATKDMQIQMASPTMIFHSASLLLCVGKSTTVNEYLHARPFFYSDSTSPYSSSADLTLQFLAEMNKAESGASTRKPLSTYANLFPFVNVFPFMGKGNIPHHLALLRRLFQVHRPWIVVSFSRFVSSCLASDFQSEHGIRASDRYLPHVGKPERHSFASLEWMEEEGQDEAPDDSYFICIKHVDPARDQREQQPEILRRVLSMTWNVTFVVVDTLLKTPEAVLQGTRKAVVTHVINEAKARLVDSGFQVRFDGVLSELDEHWRSVPHTNHPERASALLSEARKDALSAAATARVERNPFTEGAPDSPARRSQGERLWKTCNVDLHIFIPRTPEKKKDWMTWFRKIEQGRSVYMRALHDAGVERAGDELRNVLRSVPRPVGVPDGDEWMNDPILRADALERKGAQMREGLPDDHFSSENQRRRRLDMITTDPERRATYEYLETMHGREINIQANGRILFFWMRNGIEQVKLEYVVSKSLAPCYDTERRYLSFVSDGIDILNEDRKALRQTSRKGPWISHGQLVTHPRSALFLEMWRTNLPEDQHAAAAAAIPSHPPVDTPTYGPKGRPYVRHGNKQELSDLVPGDAAWIVEQFLKEHCRGARTDLISYVEDRTVKGVPCISIFRLWSHFLRRYQDHPYHAEWKQLSDDMSAWARHFQANVKLFRDVKTSKSQLKVRVNGADRWFRKWSIGAPGLPAAEV